MIRSFIVKALLALAAKYDYDIEQMNVVTAFLEAALKEEIWVQQPPEFEQIQSND